jgi:hypothetical protein
MADVTTDRWVATEVEVEDPGTDWSGSWNVHPTDGTIDPIGYVDLHKDGYHATTTYRYKEGVGAGLFPTLIEACDWVADNYEEETNA